MVCKKGEKATVTYKFSGGTKHKFITENTPITISTREGVLEDFVGGQCPIWYKFVYINHEGNLRQTDGVGVLGPVLNVKMVNAATGFSSPFDTAWFIYATGQDRDDMQFVSSNVFRVQIVYTIYGTPSFVGLKAYDPARETDSYVPPDNCGDPQKYCEILVSNLSKEIIFSDRGKCPVTYSVSCGDCPEGTFKCNKSGYPGYCCLPCEPIASSIKAIKNTVQILNKGEVSRG